MLDIEFFKEHKLNYNIVENMIFFSNFSNSYLTFKYRINNVLWLILSKLNIKYSYNGWKIIKVFDSLIEKSIITDFIKLSFKVFPNLFGKIFITNISGKEVYMIVYYIWANETTIINKINALSQFPNTFLDVNLDFSSTIANDKSNLFYSQGEASQRFKYIDKLEYYFEGKNYYKLK